MAEKVLLAKLDIDTGNVVKEQQELGNQIKNLKTQLTAAKKAGEEYTTENIKAAAQLKVLQSQYNGNQKILQGLAATEKGEIKNVQQARQVRNALNVEYEKSNNLYGENDERTQKIADSLKDLNNKINESSQSVGKGTDNVGLYNQSLDGLNVAITEATGSSNNFLASLVNIIKNPIVGAITLITGAFVGLVKMFKSTREGSVAIQKSFTGVSATAKIAKKNIRELTTEVATNHSEWKNLRKTLAVGNIFKVLKSDEFKNAKKEFKAQRDELKELTNQLIDLKDAYIDIENESLIYQGNLSNEIELLRIRADDDTLSMAEMLKAREELRLKEIELAKERKTLSDEQLKIAESELQAGIKTGDVIITNTGEIKSLTQAGIDLEQQYSEALIAVNAASNEIVRVEAENAQKRRMVELDVFEQRLDLLLDVADAEKTVNEQIIADTDRAYNERVDVLDKTKKIIDESFQDQLDLFNSTFDTELEVNKLLELNNDEIVAYTESLGLSERATNRLREVIVERRKAVQDLSQAEIELRREVADNAIEQMSNEVENEKDKNKTLLKLAENHSANMLAIKKAEENAKYELTADFAGNVAELFEEHTVLGKAAAIAQTTINTYLAAQAAYAAMAAIPVVGPGLGIAAAATAVATGLKNIQKISQVNTSLSSGGNGGITTTIGTATSSISTPTTTSDTSTYSSLSTASSTNSTDSAAASTSKIISSLKDQQVVLVIEDYEAANNKRVEVLNAARF